jgi:hypothetical protein
MSRENFFVEIAILEFYISMLSPNVGAPITP